MYARTHSRAGQVIVCLVLQMHSGRSTGNADDLKLSPGGRFGRPGGNPMSRAAVPMLRFRSDDAYATEAELSARANASARLRADLDRQVAEKQQRREQERGEGGDTGVRPHAYLPCPWSRATSGARVPASVDIVNPTWISTCCALCRTTRMCRRHLHVQ